MILCRRFQEKFCEYFEPNREVIVSSFNTPHYISLPKSALGVFFRKFLCESVFSSNLQLTSNEFSKISPHYISPPNLTKSCSFMKISS